jgi:hypothetical protein
MAIELSEEDASGYHTQKLRMTLHASKGTEGDIDVFVLDSSSISKLV